MRVAFPIPAGFRYRIDLRIDADVVTVFTLTTALWLHLAGLASLHFGYLDFLFNDAENRLGQGADFFAVLTSGDNILNGISVYGGNAEGSGIPYAYPFRYLPSVGYTFGALLNLLPAWTAYWSWVAFNEALLVVNVLLTWRFGQSRQTQLAGTVMWLVFSPYYLELFMGQFSFATGSVVFWLALALIHARRGPVLGAWTASLLIKTSSLLLLPVAFRTGWARTAIAGVAIVALINLPYFLLEEGSWDAWAANFDFASSEEGVVPHAGNQGLTSVTTLVEGETGGGLVLRISRELAALPWGFAVGAVSLGATVLAGRRQVVPLIALWTCVYFLVFDEVWEHHYVMLLPALVLLVMFEPKLRLPALLVYALLALPTPYALFKTAPPEPVDFEFVDPQTYWTTAEVYIHHLSKTLPVLLLWGFVVLYVSRGGGASVVENARTRFRDSATMASGFLRSPLP